ncbi:hypothetical protein QYE76_063658 [Lolium multiflorum]|uniref:KIB1-4 beta-propeller domain-containing protein n=1 Tax=Lolium multiflorum TaxID=4521 RepID=A0AAD8S6W4_LOLMU|nr:hypothetical protein QYE76_063658 [Lolium multiflorum]
MAKSSRVCGSGLFHKVFTEGPLEVLISQCDAITAASLVGSSKSILQSAKYSATLPASQPFGLPCVLCCDPADKPWVFKEDLPVHSKCKLLPLDRFSYDGLMPHGKDEERAGANGDWIAMVGPEGKWNLLNVYTHRKIKLPSLRKKLETTRNPLIFEYQRSAIQLQKIAICQVPTAARGYKDFSLVAIFDFAIAYLHGEYPRTWIFLENQFQYGAIYCDAIIHNGLVFAVTELGNVYAWDPNQFAAGGTFMSITLGEATKLLDNMMINYSEWHTERAPQGKKVNSVEETSSLSDKIDAIMSMLVNDRTNIDPNNVPLASLVAQEEHVDVNFIKNNNFNNNAYRNNSSNNYRPYPYNNGNGYGNSYGNSYNNNRSSPPGLEAMLKEFISTQTAFNKSVEEKLGKIDILASKVDSLAADVDLLKSKVLPNENHHNKIVTTANAIQVRINENIRLMAELRARWDREENEKLAKEKNIAKVWTITTTSNANATHVAAPPTHTNKRIGVSNVSTSNAKREKLPETAKTAETACDKAAEIFSNIGDDDPIALDYNGLNFDDCHISEVIKFLQKLAKSPNASAINLAFTHHITNALIKAREEKLEREASIPKKLEDGWEPIIKMKIKDFDCNALCDLGASISVMPKKIYNMLDLPPLKNCYLDVNLADHSTKKPLGKVDNVRITINNNLVPVDFVVLDIECNASCPIILGRPFLRTVGAIIDMKEDDKKHRVEENSILSDDKGEMACQSFKPPTPPCLLSMETDAAGPGTDEPIPGIIVPHEEGCGLGLPPAVETGGAAGAASVEPLVNGVVPREFSELEQNGLPIVKTDLTGADAGVATDDPAPEGGFVLVEPVMTMPTVLTGGGPGAGRVEPLAKGVVPRESSEVDIGGLPSVETSGLPGAGIVEISANGAVPPDSYELEHVPDVPSVEPDAPVSSGDDSAESDQEGSASLGQDVSCHSPEPELKSATVAYIARTVLQALKIQLGGSQDQLLQAIVTTKDQPACFVISCILFDKLKHCNWRIVQSHQHGERSYVYVKMIHADLVRFHDKMYGWGEARATFCSIHTVFALEPDPMDAYPVVQLS